MSALYYEKDGSLYVDENCRYIMLVYTDAKNNNNKFYELRLDNNKVHAAWGRVGNSKSTSEYHGGFSDFKKKANEKFKKGYKPVEIESGLNDVVNVNKSLSKTSLLEHAIAEITYKPVKNTRDYGDKHKSVVEDLIKMLVESNRHEIQNKSGNQIEIDDNGLVKTVLGVLISEHSINKAMVLLEELKHLSNNSDDFINKLNEYLALIPQKVNNHRGWHLDFFNSRNTFEKQYDFLEQLLSSVKTQKELLENASKQQVKENQKNEEVLFERKLKLVTDKKIIDYVNDLFESNKSKNHSSSHLKLKRVFEICYVDENQNIKHNNNPEFDKIKDKLGNMHTYWHGTRKFNILSILKNGLIIPKSNAFNCTGRMFGDGVYFSHQSTKALNYSYGYWDGGAKDNNCFMFLADVVMGKVFDADNHKNIEQEKGKRKVYPVKGYDSTHAKGNANNLIHGGSVSRLSNDEMIVYDLNQINLRYLCEFE